MVAAMSMITACYFSFGLASIVIVLLGLKWQFALFFVPLPLILMLFLIVTAIPLFLNWSRNMYGTLLWGMVIFIVFSLAIYTSTYMITGVNYNGVKEYNIWSSVYFSLNTFTTLGYGDFSPIKHFRLIASSQAFIGIMTVPILISIIWLYCSERLHRPVVADEDNIGKTFTPDGVYGMLREISPEAAKDRVRRKQRLNLVDCAICSSNSQEIEKYFDWIGKTHPVPRFVVRCKCGHFTKPYSNAYFAAYSWNRINKNLKRRFPLSHVEMFLWFQFWLLLMFSGNLIKNDVWAYGVLNGSGYYVSLSILLVTFIIRCYAAKKVKYSRLLAK